MTTGPFFPPQFLDPDVDDLTVFDGARARGSRILLTGRVLEEGLGATVNTIVEIWQADASGILRHPKDPRYAHVDPGFAGWGRSFTDTDGWYRLRTVLPGRYASAAGAPRCPHINVMLLASGILRPLVTTVFFGDPAGRPDDPVLQSVADPAQRRRLFAVRDPERDTDGVQAYRFDIVLRGDEETPFFLD
jgi:protocatechuate 3,4-dioxygenase alpha subunit